MRPLAHAKPTINLEQGLDGLVQVMFNRGHHSKRDFPIVANNVAGGEKALRQRLAIPRGEGSGIAREERLDLASILASARHSRVLHLGIWLPVPCSCSR